MRHGGRASHEYVSISCVIMKIRYSLDEATACVELLVEELVRLCASVPAAYYDLHWLRLRCEDTLVYHGELQQASMGQLVKDIEAFSEEFPGVLSPDLLQRCLKALDAAAQEP